MRQRYLWIVLVGLSLGLMGCATTQTIGSGGTTRVVLGPIVVEAKSTKEVLPKFEDGLNLLIAGRPNTKLIVNVLNRTQDSWKLVVREKRSNKNVFTQAAMLKPMTRKSLSRLLAGQGNPVAKLLFVAPLPTSQNKLRKLELLLYKANHSINPNGRRVVLQSSPFVKSPTYRMMLTYGLCQSYQQADIYSQWCESHNSNVANTTPGFDMLWRLR
ncbi:MAG: hypothetical protein EP343_09810 [Deltaproteobacteria bacterium]|nr:MAG: hypothetical protein EP343_09810 [Deltaproteobacteria bacterium]